jgi:RNA polymerase sigma-70 factor (ECF subfamily)
VELDALGVGIREQPFQESGELRLVGAADHRSKDYHRRLSRAHAPERPGTGVRVDTGRFIARDSRERTEASRMTTLSEIFLLHAPEERRGRFSSVPDLEDALAGLVARGRAAWSEVALAEADFVAFLGRCLPEDVALELATLRGEDLWLVCASGRGVPGASEALDKHYLEREAAALSRLGAPPTMIDDVLQEIRTRIVEMQTQTAGQRAYAGRGSLGGWLRVAAVRSMNRRRARRARELMVGTGPVLIASPDHEPETALLLNAHKLALTAAFQEALASLPQRDRSVLRYHFVEGLGIDPIGELYRVHRSTAARWIERACDALSERTRDALRRRITIGEESFQRIVGLLESQIAVELARVDRT